MEENIFKITIPLPQDNLAGATTESVWAEAQGEDVVQADAQEGALVFKRVVRRNGHSTYRIYAASGRTAPEVVSLVGRLQQMHCDIEPATDTLVGVDVLPQADIHKVYDTLADAERKGKIDFQEGHCGHLLRSKP